MLFPSKPKEGIPEPGARVVGAVGTGEWIDGSRTEWRAENDGRDGKERDLITGLSLVGASAGLGWLVLIFCERKILLAGWFELAETHKRTG